MTISNLLVGEIGRSDQDDFDVHAGGLVRVILQRGGVGGLHESIATTVTL
jgi:hypothetical protein